jgi:hypothetical protein
VSGHVGLAGKAGRRVEYRAGVLKDKEGDMHLLLVVGLAVGTDAEHGGASFPEVVARLTAPSEWALEWLEADGKRFYLEGGLKLDRNGRGELLYGDWRFEITGRCLDPVARRSSIDLRLKGLASVPAVGIYSVNGGRLFLCITGERKRPTGFATKPGDNHMTLVFRRKK